MGYISFSAVYDDEQGFSLFGGGGGGGSGLSLGTSEINGTGC